MIRGRGDRLLRETVRAQRRQVMLSALAGIGHQSCEALVPVLIGVIVDHAIAPSDAEALIWWILLLALLFVVLSSSFRLQLRLWMRVQQHAEHDLRVALTERILDPGGIDLAAVGSPGSGAPGALLNIAGDDARQSARIVEAAVLLVAALAALCVASAVLLAVSVPLGLIVLVGTPLLVAGLHRIAHVLRSRCAAEQARAADAAAVATDLVRGVRVLKGIGAEGVSVDRYSRASRASLGAALRTAVAENLLGGANVLIGGAVLVVVALVGGRLALDGTIGIGALIAAVGLTQFLIGPLQRMGLAVGLLAEARASADRAAALLAAPPAVTGGAAAPPASAAGALRLHQLRLHGGGAPGLELEVRLGEHVGVVVTDAAEAAALIDVLARRRDSVDGEVALDGVRLADLPLTDAHRLLLVADHDAELFEGSVADNVGAAAPGLDPGRRHAVLAACAADEAVAALPGGLDAPVGERGVLLSGGQRQRIALARALAADPPVLVLHDPTTAVDAVTEARIATGLRRLRTGRTTVVLASSPSLLEACRRVVLVIGGVIVAEGTHEQLAERDERYREAVVR